MMWHTMIMGDGQVTYHPDHIVCQLPAHTDQHYHNAQIDDYAATRPPQFQWSAPLELSLTAQFSHPLDQMIGTAGFGFWNHPLMPHRVPRVPRAVWFFFASPPSNMALAQGVAGYGFKTATFDALNPLFLGLAPLTPLGFLLMRVPVLYRRLWPVGQHALRVDEHLLTHDITQPHTYRLRWLKNAVEFAVDEQIVHTARYAPRGKLGFVAWLDNQYAIITPQGQLGFGVLARPTLQYLQLSDIRITRL